MSGGSVVHPCPLPLAWQADIPASLGEDMKMSSTSLNVLIACFSRGGVEERVGRFFGCADER